MPIAGRGLQDSGQPRQARLPQAKLSSPNSAAQTQQPKLSSAVTTPGSVTRAAPPDRAGSLVSPARQAEEPPEIRKSSVAIKQLWVSSRPGNAQRPDPSSTVPSKERSFHRQRRAEEFLARTLIHIRTYCNPMVSLCNPLLCRTASPRYARSPQGCGVNATWARKPRGHQARLPVPERVPDGQLERVSTSQYLVFQMRTCAPCLVHHRAQAVENPVEKTGAIVDDRCPVVRGTVTEVPPHF